MAMLSFDSNIACKSFENEGVEFCLSFLPINNKYLAQKYS
jgi:hypothetical protein